MTKEQSAKITPGPWKVSRRFDIYQDTQDHGGGGRYIGTTRGNEPLPWSIESVDEANATLMAAAPDLLSLLIEVIDDGLKTNTKDWQQRANSVIKQVLQ